MTPASRAHFHILPPSLSDFATAGYACSAEISLVAFSLACVPSVSNLPPDTLACRPGGDRGPLELAMTRMLELRHEAAAQGDVTV
jgi:hypothetical protein